MLGAYEAIPLELRELKNWCLWKRVILENGKTTKVPYQPDGRKCDVTNAETFNTFNVCYLVLATSNYDGLGFIFTNTSYAGIDLDDPAFLADGLTPNPNYQLDLDRQIKISREFDSYSEVSPSGKGLHIIVKGSVEAGRKRNKIEIYSSGRYFTMTGNAYNNKPIADCQDLLTQLWAQMGPEISPQLVNAINKEQEESDEEIIKRAINASNGDKFSKLLSGEWNSDYQSQSEADFAFIDIIAFYTQNRIQIARIFRASPLGKRPKAKREDYVSGMIQRSFDRMPPPINFEGMKEALEAKLGSVAQRLEPAAHNGSVAGSNPAASTTYDLPPGLLGEIAAFIYNAAPRPVPEVALAAAIGLMAGICGRAYNISGTGLNQYVLLLAMTGAGKEAAASGINKLMNTIKMQVPTSTGFIGPSEISSGAALFKFLGNQSQSFISLLGEFGLRLQQMSSPNANGSEVSLRRMFLDLYNKSGASEILHASVYSDKANNTGAVPSPSFSILGESTPERFYGALNEDMISEGLLPRFLLIEYKGNRPPLNEQHASVLPTMDLVAQLASLAAYCETINHANPRKIVNVQATTEASKLLHDFDKYADDRINTSTKDVIRQLWNRAHIKVLKLAALIAVGENMSLPTIDERSMLWAKKLVEADIAALTIRFEAGEIGSNSFELTQSKEAIRIFKDYVEKDFDYVKKYGAVQIQHKDRVVNNDYLNRRLAPLAAFRNDKNGKTVALKRTLNNLVDAGKIIELKGKDKERFKYSGVLYFICPEIMDC